MQPYMNDFSHVLTRDLRRRRDRLEEAMQSCTDPDDFLGCLARLQSMDAELRRREGR